MQAYARAISSGGQPPIPYDQLVGVTQATISAIQTIRSDQSVTINPITLKEN
jgi:hypothetical protein